MAPILTFFRLVSRYFFFLLNCYLNVQLNILFLYIQADIKLVQWSVSGNLFLEMQPGHDIEISSGESRKGKKYLHFG